MDAPVLLGSREYFLFLSLLLFARGMDFLSTWIATPSLELEANPLARFLGWRWGILVNGVMCLLMAAWPLPAIIVSTTSILVASRNFQVAWQVRSTGEESYRAWMLERISETPPGFFLFCLFAQGILVGMVGAALVWVSPMALVPFGIGLGIMAYAMALVIFTLIAMWRHRRGGRG